MEGVYRNEAKFEISTVNEKNGGVGEECLLVYLFLVCFIIKPIEKKPWTNHLTSLITHSNQPPLPGPFFSLFCLSLSLLLTSPSSYLFDLIYSINLVLNNFIGMMIKELLPRIGEGAILSVLACSYHGYYDDSAAGVVKHQWQVVIGRLKI